MNIFELLEYEEGFRAKPYYCSEGFVTIGIGSLIGPKHADLDLYQFTVNREVAEAMLMKELLQFTANAGQARLVQYVISG